MGVIEFIRDIIAWLFGIERIKIIGKVRMIFTDIHTGAQEITPWKKNIIVTTGKVSLLRVLANIATISNAGRITYGAVGTGENAVLVSDTILQTELERKAVSVSSISGSMITLRVFFTASEANGSLKEFAWFGEDATAAADSGTMFNHISIDKTKTSDKTLTIEQTFTYA